MKSFSALSKESNEAGVRFVMTELGLASSFLYVADYASVPRRREQSLEHARMACDAVVHFAPRPSSRLTRRPP
jgi:hypothetical protein